MKKLVKKKLSRFLHKNRNNAIRKKFLKQIKSRLENIKNINVDTEKEKQFVRKWERLSKDVSPLYYRAYSSLSQNYDINYVPDFLYSAYIEPIMNNYKMIALGQEKNYYDKLFNEYPFPITILRNINGIYCDFNYQHIDITDKILLDYCLKYEQIFIKPTIDTGQGKNVMKFIKKENNFFANDETKLSVEFLQKKFKQDFIVQESIRQSSFLNQFNESALNTLRVLTYRSIKDNKVYVLHVTLRIGKDGSLIDASRAGGRFCGVNADGSLMKIVYAANGSIYSDFNGVDITKKEYKLPNYDKTIELSANIAKQIYHHRVLALDVALDNNNQPRIIEINPLGQGMFIFQASIGPMFKEFTDEVIDYCVKNKAKYLNDYTLDL